MSNPKGTQFATSVLPLFKQYYPDAERAPSWGAKDRGDLLLPGERRFIVELKNVKAMNLSGWLAEAAAEAENAESFWQTGYVAGVVVHKRRGNARPSAQYVTMRLGDFLDLVKR